MARFLKNPDITRSGKLAVRLPVVPSDSYGDSPVDGLIRFNQSSTKVELFYNGAWNQIAKIQKVPLVIDTFAGDNSTSTFTMTQPESNDSDVLVTIGGVYQQPGVQYQVSGSSITFGSPPPAPGINPNKIVVIHNLNATGIIT